MDFYSDFSHRRAWQIIADLCALAGIIGAVTSGVIVHNTIAALSAIWISMVEAGEGFSEKMSEIGETLESIPFVGDAARSSFDAVGGAGALLADVGNTARGATETLATVAGLGVAFLPLAILALIWLWPRLRFVRGRRMAQAFLRLDDGESLLALRALQSATPAQLAKISARPLSAWRADDKPVTRALAALSARDAGIRLDKSTKLSGNRIPQQGN